MRRYRITVVAAVIEQDGKVLIGQRQANDRHAFKWEFPGGKVEPGETPVAALQRELEEELAIQAIIGPEITRYEFQYQSRSPILLIFHRVMRYQGEPRCEAFEQIRWETRQRLPEYDFVEGDADFVSRLSRGEW